MKKKNILSLAIVISMLLATLPPLTVRAQTTAIEVVFENGENEIYMILGNVFAVTLRIENTPPIGMWVVKLEWDPNVLELETGTENDITEGPFMKSVASTIFLRKPPQLGSIPEMTCAFIGEQSASGTGDLAYIKFRTKGIGETGISIVAPGNESYLLNPTFTQLVRFDPVNGLVVVPLPPATPPNAEFTPADGTRLRVNSTVNLDGSISTDGHDTLPYPPGHVVPITSWLWEIDIGNNGTDPYDFTLSGETASFVGSSLGDVGITLTVTAPDNMPPTAGGYIDHDWEKHVILILSPWHDVAMTNVSRNQTVVIQGDSARINVTTQNQGNFTETFNVTLYQVTSSLPINETGLVGYWKFDEGSGTTAYDSSGNSNNGTIYGSTRTSGKVGNALSFDGIDDYLQVNDSPSLNITGNQFTLSAWINPRKQSYISGDIVTKKLGLVAQYYIAWLWNGSHIGFGTGLYNGNNVWFGANKYHPLNNWYHVVSVYNGTRLQLFVNNQLEIDQPVSGNLLHLSVPLHIAWMGPTWGPLYFNGTIDEVRIYDRALSEEEIRTLATKGPFTIQTQTVTLESGASTTLTFTWDTSGLALGNYTISAYAWPVPGERDTIYNWFIDGEIMISKLGDLNLDSIVNYKDASLFRQAYIGAYNYLADFNQDGTINYKDASLFRGYYIEG